MDFIGGKSLGSPLTEAPARSKRRRDQVGPYCRRHGGDCGNRISKTRMPFILQRHA